ncbi:MAG: cytochrome c oxidase assembly protein [Verrucomicrobia bacterium]|nr:cytochrome c oxidase assembly protein [Verrucomicrobiota bacterium]
MIDWRHWHNEPHLVGGLILLGWLYAVLTGPLRDKIAPGAAYPRAHAIKFYGALILFYLAVGSPLDQAGERFLLSAHMVQHALLIYPAAVLFLMGLPAWLVRPVTARPSLKHLLGFLSRPLICGLIYILTYSLWHVPALYDWALQDRWVHIAEHIMFFGAALFYWLPLLSPSTEFPPIRPPSQMLYLVAVVIGMTPVFAYIAFSDDILYPTYEYAPRLFKDFSPENDQLLGAVIMKGVGMGVTFIAFLCAFYRWYQTTERKSGPSGSSRPLHGLADRNQG